MVASPRSSKSGPRASSSYRAAYTSPVETFATSPRTAGSAGVAGGVAEAPEVTEVASDGADGAGSSDGALAEAGTPATAI